MSFLVLTRRPDLPNLARALGSNVDSTVVVTTEVRPDSIDLIGCFRHVEQVQDYDDASVGQSVLALACRFGVERIASTNEVDVLRAAAARQLLGIAGQSMPSAVAFRDKYVMKSIAHAEGIPVARMRRACSRDKARAAAAEMCYPVAVKPVDGGGSVNVHRLTAAQDWASAPELTEYLVEEWIDAKAFYTVDGLMCDGDITQHVVLRMLSGNLTFLIGRMPVAGYSLAEGFAASRHITEFVARVLRAMPPVPHETAFHMELFEHRSGRLMLCEVASRAGGVGHAPTFGQATGIDLNAASLLGQLGLDDPRPAQPRLREAAFAYYPKCSGTLLHHPKALRHPSVTSYVALADAGTCTSSARWVGDCIAKIHLASPVGADIGEQMVEVMNEYESHTVWSQLLCGRHPAGTA